MNTKLKIESVLLFEVINSLDIFFQASHRMVYIQAGYFGSDNVMIRDPYDGGKRSNIEYLCEIFGDQGGEPKLICLFRNKKISDHERLEFCREFQEVAQLLELMGNMMPYYCSEPFYSGFCSCKEYIDAYFE